MAPLTALQIVKKFGNSTWPARDCNANLVGSGQFEFIVNNYARSVFAERLADRHPRRVRTTSAGSVQTTQLITGAFPDLSGGAPSFICTRVLRDGLVERSRRVHASAQQRLDQSSDSPGFTLWGDLSLYQANGATLMRSWTQDYHFGASAVSLANGPHPTASGTALSCAGTTTVTCTNSFNAFSVGQYLYIAPGSALTTGNYLITAFTNASNIVLASSPGTGSGATWRIGGGTDRQPRHDRLWRKGLSSRQLGRCQSPLVPSADLRMLQLSPGTYSPLFFARIA